MTPKIGLPACRRQGLHRSAICCPLDRSLGAQPDLGRHEIKEHLHPQRQDASGEDYLLDFFLSKVLGQQPHATIFSY
jgi:hypothetical protein